jgi:hypothetical protein
LAPHWYQDMECINVLDPADPQCSKICSLRRFIFPAAVELASIVPAAKVLRFRPPALEEAARHFRSLTASRTWARMGSIFTLGSALWTRCPLLISRSAQLCWRSSACGLLHSFFLDRRKRISGRTWICSAVSPTNCAPHSLYIAFAPTSWSRTVWDQRLCVLPVSMLPKICGLGNGQMHSRSSTAFLAILALGLGGATPQATPLRWSSSTTTTSASVTTTLADPLQVFVCVRVSVCMYVLVIG